jgi:hypothetical protein
MVALRLEKSDARSDPAVLSEGAADLATPTSSPTVTAGIRLDLAVFQDNAAAAPKRNAAPYVPSMQ